MIQPQLQPPPTPLAYEELANSVSHGVGLVAAIIAVPILVIAAIRHGDGAFIIGSSVFAASMVLLYLASTLYHSVNEGPTKRLFRLLDHCAIFLLIAGSYTPFTLGVLRGTWGWTLLVMVWTLATIGLTIKACFGTRFKWASMMLYVGMGWLAVIAAKPILLHVPLPGILLVVLGGLAYTSGLGFFAAHRLRYHHLIWHLFVILGTTCHFFAVLWYAKPFVQ